MEGTCDAKRCIHCGPRKKAILRIQLENTLGRNAYVGRIRPEDGLEGLEQSLERLRNRAQRNGDEFNYHIVGDRTLGWIVASNTPIIAEQRYMDLASWWQRISDLYHRAASRLRRTRAFGRLPRVPLKRKGNSGHLFYRTRNSELSRVVEAGSWHDMLHQTIELQQWTYVIDPTKPLERRSVSGDLKLDVF